MSVKGSGVKAAPLFFATHLHETKSFIYLLKIKSHTNGKHILGRCLDTRQSEQYHMSDLCGHS